MADKGHVFELIRLQARGKKNSTLQHDVLAHCCVCVFLFMANQKRGAMTLTVCRTQPMKYSGHWTVDLLLLINLELQYLRHVSAKINR